METRHQTEGSIRERVREPTTDDAAPTMKVVEHQRKENGGVEKEPDAAKCPSNVDHVAQPHGGMNDKADRYAILRLGKKGRARDRQRVKRRWEVGSDTETGNPTG